MAILVVFREFFGYKMAKVGHIDLKIVLSINLDLNEGQNKNNVRKY